MKIALLGAGAWGTALAHQLALNGHNILIWALEQAVVTEINTTHRNSTYLPGIPLHQSVRATASLNDIVSYELICIALPVPYIRATLHQATDLQLLPKSWILASKGIENNTLLVPSQILNEYGISEQHICVLSGPSFADEVAREEITGVTLASNNTDLISIISALFQNPTFHVEPSIDLLGVQAAGALKNIAALALGICDGYSGSQNMRAYLFTLCMGELIRSSTRWGTSLETWLGLAGIGDLFLTCSSLKSKNYRYGYAVGTQMPPDQLAAEFPTTPEGINTLASIGTALTDRSLFPILTALSAIIFEQEKPEILAACLRSHRA